MFLSSLEKISNILFLRERRLRQRKAARLLARLRLHLLPCHSIFSSKKLEPSRTPLTRGIPYKHCSPQASAQAGIRAHVAPRAFIAAFSPRASPQGRCARSPCRKRVFVADIEARRLQRKHVVPRAFITAFSLRTPPQGAYTQSPRRKRIFVAGIAARRLQH